jgi:hypothetical protein
MFRFDASHNNRRECVIPKPFAMFAGLGFRTRIGWRSQFGLRFVGRDDCRIWGDLPAVLRENPPGVTSHRGGVSFAMPTTPNLGREFYSSQHFLKAGIRAQFVIPRIGVEVHHPCGFFVKALPEPTKCFFFLVQFGMYQC